MANLEGLHAGLQYLDAKNYASAIVEFEQVMKAKGARFEIYELMGVSHFHMKSWKESIRNLSKAISYLESPKPSLYYFRGLAHLYHGELALSLNDLFLSMRYTPVEELHEKANLLSSIFFVCILAGDNRSQRIFRLGYSSAPVKMMVEVQRLFDAYFVRLNIPVEKKISLQKNITTLLNQAKKDKKIIDEMTKLRGEKLGALLGDLKGLKLSKVEKTEKKDT